MLRNTLLTVAAAAALAGGALALQPSQAQAGVDGYIEIGHRSHKDGDQWRHRDHRRCYVVFKRVRHGWYWGWRPVRICKPYRWHRHW